MAMYRNAYDTVVDVPKDEWIEEDFVCNIITMTGFAVWRTQCMRMTLARAMSFGIGKEAL